MEQTSIRSGPSSSPERAGMRAWADAGLALAVAGSATGRAVVDGAPAVVSIGVGVACLTLAARRRWPVAVLAALVVATTAAAAAGSLLPPLFVGAEIALYTLAARNTRTRTVVAAVLTALALFGAARSAAYGPLTEPGTLIIVVWTALAAALGDAVRNHRAYVTSLAERAQRAEETRDAVARARVTEERVRIARELHDVVAHNLAVVSVHAGLAARTVRTAPATAEESLGHVQTAARTALDELGAVLRVLRADAPDDDARPAPGLDDLDDLLGTFARLDLAVRKRTTGLPAILDPACDLTAFRIIQESLTNAHKHGTGATAQVDLHHRPDGVDIVVSNPVRWPAPEHDDSIGTGHGITGMRERVESVGGSLTAQVGRDGVFRVVAHIPVAPSPRDASMADVPSEQPR
jgi:signal transduction histidine kinase